LILFRLRLTSLDDVNFTLTNWLNDTITTRNIILSICKKINKYSDWKKIECYCSKAIFSTRYELVNNYFFIITVYFLNDLIFVIFVDAYFINSSINYIIIKNY